MEYYNLFVKVVFKEVTKLNLKLNKYSTHVAELSPALNENFTLDYNRCAYMFRYATVLTYFFNDCIKHFFSNCSLAKDIISKWKSYSKVKVCSFSTGPGLDYIGFMLALLEHDSSPPNFEVTVITKHGAWRNTVNLILEVLNDPGTGLEFPQTKLQYQNVNVVQVDWLKNFSLGNNIIHASEANIILMMKTMNLLAPGTPQEGSWLRMFQELFSALKPETIVFCVDTKPSIAVLIQATANIPGKFLYDPSGHAARIQATLPEVNGQAPTTSSRGVFFVWQKLPDSLSSNLLTSPLNTAKSSIIKNNDDNLIGDNPLDKSVASVENMTNLDCKDSDAELNPPWKELKSFWQSATPEIKEVLKKLMLSNKERLENINVSTPFQSQEENTNAKNPLNTVQNLAVEDAKIPKLKEITAQTVKMENIKIDSSPSQSTMQDSSLNKQKNILSNWPDFYSYGNGSASSDTLNSVSSFTCENTSSGRSVQQSTDMLPITSSETFHSYSQNTSVKNDSKVRVMPKEQCENYATSENKIIQTDVSLDNPTTPSSVKAMTDKIRRLVVSLENVTQPNETSGSGGDFLLLNHHDKQPDKPSCSKQDTSFSSQGQNSSPTYQSDRNVLCQDTGSHYSCQFYHNSCMHCRFQHCCSPPIPRCCFDGNQQQSRENVRNVTSPNIVIPLQSISDDALLQIISILRLDSKK